MTQVTMQQARDRWVRHTNKVVYRPFGKPVWGYDEKGNPQVSGDTWTISFHADSTNGHVYGSAHLNESPH